MRHISISRRARTQRGGTLVELTLVLTLVLTMLLGVLEVGRLLFTYTTLAQAARSGVRYAITHGALRAGSGVNGPSGPGNDPTQVKAAVTNITSAAGLTTGLISTPIVTYPDGTNTAGSRVSVTVTYPFSTVVPLLPLNVTLTSTSEGTICY